MKRPTTGLSVRFLSVAMLTGHDRAGKSTGNTLSDLKYATDLGIAVILVVPGVRRLHNPRLIDKLGKIDLAATGRPFALGSRGDHQLVIEKKFNIQVIRRPLLIM